METANRSEFDLLPTPQAERSEQLAVDVLRVLSASLGAGPALESFHRSLTANVADLVGASRVLFWELGPDRMLRPIRGAHGVEDELVARLDPVPCDPEGTDPTNQVVLRALQVSDAIAAPWQSGDTRLGVVAAYDSINAEGFTSEEAWILEISGLAAGLVWQVRQAADQLSETVERLREVDSARHRLLRNLSTAVDRASKRFATELHDDALQKLTAAEIRLAGLAASMAGDESKTGIDEISALLQQVEDALRNLLQNVRPPSLETPGGLEMTIRQRLAALSAQSGITAECLVELPDEPPYEIKSVLHRQVSEALTNIEKHAQATRVRLELKVQNDGVYGAVTDNGKGFIVSDRDHLPGHLGLLALSERPLLAGGWGKIASEPGVGTIVEFWVPLRK
ncbi:MAG TPA: histidine kinase [Candidatus Dormibacteraeota bacterium]|nr:histidine kinase [Candidatus Dormibacteraeota bacterium]